MTDPTRREFLLSTGSVIATGAMLGRIEAAALALDTADANRPAVHAAAIPPHRALPIQGVHLYTDKPSYAAGETLTAYVSTTLPCQLEVVRLGEVIDDPVKDEVLHQVRIEQPAMQPVHPGSYIHVEPGLPARAVTALTLECWVRLWNVHEPQAIVSQLDDAAGFGLLVFPDGTLGLFTGEAADPAATTHRTTARLTLPGKPTFSPYVTPPADWHHVVAVVSGGQKTIWLDGRRVGQWPRQQPLVPAACPLRIGALGRAGQAAGLLDADIALPVIYGRALDELEIRTRYAERGLATPEVDPDLWGCWPLAEERGAALADISPAARQGRIINHATWMIGGPSFMPVIARYRRDYDPRRDATRGHGLRLASDDLYDCRWQPTFTCTLPTHARSGLYAVRGRFLQNGADAMTHASFVVRRAPDAAPAPIALLFSTNTWKAYSAAPFGPAWPGVYGYFNTNGHKPQRDDPLAAYCFYRAHRAGQPTYQLGWRMPW
ncbi:MAG TPA: LamG domain-containing protein, partial [Pirellulales bacterium]